MVRRKKKNKFKKILLWSIGILLVLGISGLFVMNYAINKVIESMADSLVSEIALESSTPNNSDEVSANNEVSDSNVSEDNNSQENNLTEDSQETIVPSKEIAGTGKKSDGIKADNTPNKDEVGVYSSNVSTDKAIAIKENVTLSEKKDVTSILMGNLSLSDIKLFQELAGGGMTVDEKREARKVLLDKLTPEEYNTLSQIAKKYGVSRGITYDQAEEEEANSSK